MIMIIRDVEIIGNRTNAIDKNSELSSCDIPVCFMIYYGCLLDLKEYCLKAKCLLDF